MASFAKLKSSGDTRQRTLTFRVVGNSGKMTELHSALGAMQRIADTVRETAQLVLKDTEDPAQAIHELGAKLYAAARIAEPEMCSKPTQTLVQRTLPSRDRSDINKFLRAKTSRGTLILDAQTLDVERTDNRWTYWLQVPVTVAIPEGKKCRRVTFRNYALAGKYSTEQLQRPEVLSINQVTLYRRLRKDCLCIFASVVITEQLPPLKSSGKVAGLDMNLDQMVLNDGKHFKMGSYHDSKRHLRDRMKRPDGPQLEKALKKKESDYGKDFVRKLANKIACHLDSTGVSVLSLEDLTKLTSDIKKAWTEKQKERNRRLKSSFPFAALRVALIPACRKLSIVVKPIKPAYTSQGCSRCGHVCKDNRTTQSRFVCVRCGYKANADVNAAINIRERIVDPEGLRFRVPDSVPPGAAQLKHETPETRLSEVSML